MVRGLSLATPTVAGIGIGVRCADNAGRLLSSLRTLGCVLLRSRRHAQLPQQGNRPAARVFPRSTSNRRAVDAPTFAPGDAAGVTARDADSSCRSFWTARTC